MAKVLPDGEEVSQDLGGMELVGQAVPHRHTGVVGKVFHDLLAIAPVLDAVEHAAQHTGSVGDGLLLADLAAGRVKVGHFHAQIVGSDLEAATGAGGGLFKDQGDVLACQLVIVADAGLLFCLLRQGPAILRSRQGCSPIASKSCGSSDSLYISLSMQALLNIYSRYSSIIMISCKNCNTLSDMLY